MAIIVTVAVAGAAAPCKCMAAQAVKDACAEVMLVQD
jgi:hypothetical protein